MLSKFRQVALLALAALMGTGSASAHHSRAVYDLSRYVEVKGTVVDWKWTSPHSELKLAVADASGKTAEWVLECPSPAFMVRYGWKRTDIKLGDKISVLLRPMRDGSLGGSTSQVTLASGKVMGGPDAPPAGYKPGEKSPQKGKRAEDLDDDI